MSLPAQRLRFGTRKQVPGDLTWDAPPELDPDWGLNSDDKERRAQQAAQQLLEPMLSADADPPAEGPAGAESEGHTSMFGLQQSLFASASQQHLAKVRKDTGVSQGSAACLSQLDAAQISTAPIV